MASIWNGRHKQILFFLNLNTKATTLKGKKNHIFYFEPGLDVKRKCPSVYSTTSHLLSSTQLIAEQTKVG